MKAVLEGKDISRSYRKDSRVIQALHPISFQVEQGEILGIVGESGSGKSTLLKQIAGLEVSDTGELFIDGEQLELTRHFDRRKRYREIQMGQELSSLSLFQDCKHLYLNLFGFFSELQRDL